MISEDERHDLTMAKTLTTEIINAAIDGYEAQKVRIDAQIAELRAMLPDGSIEAASATVRPGQKRRRISAAGRARIAEAQRQRWASLQGSSEERAAAPVKAKRRLSAAGRKNIIDALKRRWAAKRAAAAKASKKTRPARKKAAAKKAVKRPPAAKKTAPAPAPAATQAAG
jgi:hypothetical protein